MRNVIYYIARRVNITRIASTKEWMTVREDRSPAPQDEERWTRESDRFPRSLNFVAKILKKRHFRNSGKRAWNIIFSRYSWIGPKLNVFFATLDPRSSIDDPALDIISSIMKKSRILWLRKEKLAKKISPKKISLKKASNLRIRGHSRNEDLCCCERISGSQFYNVYSSQM